MSEKVAFWEGRLFSANQSCSSENMLHDWLEKSHFFGHVNQGNWRNDEISRSLLYSV